MRRLRKSGSERVLFGVAGGLGDYFDLDPVLVRVGFIALCFAGGAGIVLYVVLAVVIPRADAPEGTTAEAVQDNVEHIGDEAAEAGRRLSNAMGSGGAGRGRNAGGVLLIAIGAFILLSQIGLFFWLRWDIFLPATLIAVGIFIVARRPRSSP